LQGYAKRIAASEFDATAGATVELALKDVRYMRQLADACTMPLPMADVVFGHLQSAAANGHADKDVGALVLAVQQAAGLKPLGDK
jgi:3-hydroxyisobutyrate dehydrogenase-like beta-hydroxyacid dehydrogenase